MNAHRSPHPTDLTLEAFGLGKLAEDEAEGVSAHLEECPACRERVTSLSSDTFLARVRDAQRTADQPSTPRPPAPGRAAPKANPAAVGAIPPELANHPDYNILRELGRGGMGVVYLAHNELMGRDEVLKVMGQHIVSRPGVLDRFLREIRAVARLRHPNIVTAYSASRLGDSIMFSMEYVDGLDLSRMVKAKGPLPVAHACNFIHQAALGLEHAHEEGLIHRDIKPGNLMLSRKGTKPIVKILDFGLAKATREEKVDSGLTSEGQALGTPDFIAPEQILDAQKADIRADIYSLGGTLYYLLTGRPPFKANSLYDIYQAHISRDADLLNLVRPEVPAELAALVSKMMAKDPSRRFQTPAEVAKAIVPFFKSTNPALRVSPRPLPQAGPGLAPPTSPLPSPSDSPAQPSRRDRTVAPAGPQATASAERTVAEPRWESLINIPESDSGTESTPPPLTSPVAPATTQPPWFWPAVAGGALVLFLLIAMFSGILRFRTTDGTLVVENPPEGAEVLIDGASQTLEIKGTGEPVSIRIAPGKHQVEVRKGDVVLKGEEVTIETGGKPTVIRLEPDVQQTSSKPTATGAQPVAARPNQGTSLFNGRDLAGWTDLLPNGSVWSVADGAIVGRWGGAQKPAVLELDNGNYRNFRLSFQVKHLGPANGWVEVRRQPVLVNDFSGGPGVTNAYAIGHYSFPDAATRTPPRFTGNTGKAVNYQYGTQGQAFTLARQMPFELNVWHTIVITVKDSRITTSVDNTNVCEYEDPESSYARGTIALASDQSDAGIAYRDIRVEELPDPGKFEVNRPTHQPIRAFNGRDLTGWTDLLANGSEWSVADMCIQGKAAGPGKPAVLVLDNHSFKDFRLRFQVRHSQPAYGWIEVRRQAPPGPNETNCYAIATTSQPDIPRRLVSGSTGKTTSYNYGNPAQATQAASAVPFALGLWHQYEVIVEGSRVVTSIAGTKVCEYEDPSNSYPVGGIALGVSTVEPVEFREILIEEFRDGSAAAEPAPKVDFYAQGPPGSWQPMNDATGNPILGHVPHLSPDGLELVYTLVQPNGEGRAGIVIARRASVDQPFGPPALQAKASTPGHDNAPTLIDNGLTLLFNSRPLNFTIEGQPAIELRRARRARTGVDFEASEVVAGYPALERGTFARPMERISFFVPPAANGVVCRRAVLTGSSYSDDLSNLPQSQVNVTFGARIARVGRSGTVVILNEERGRFWLALSATRGGAMEYEAPQHLMDVNLPDVRKAYQVNLSPDACFLF
ncbi:MAG: family 16 glycoside hydrolase [Isosphaeraceae bacterium]